MTGPIGQLEVAMEHASVRGYLPKMSGRIAWGLVDQTLSSITNFALVLIVGRRLGAASLGHVSVGFAAFVLCLVLHRSLLIEPLVIESVALPPSERRSRTGLGFSASLVLAAGMASVIAFAGLIISGRFGHGLLIFAPWIPAALVQDLVRFVLFRDHKARMAAANDLFWVLAMGTFLWLTWRHPHEWTTIMSWGAGAAVAAVVGIFQTGSRAKKPAAAVSWWLGSAWGRARWLGLDTVTLNLGLQGYVFVAAFILAPAEVGGLRAGQSVFAPLSVLGPAVNLPGLPALASALDKSATAARRLAFYLSLVPVLLSLSYFVAMLFVGDRLLQVLFGPSFSRYADLIFPIALAQLFVAAGNGYVLFLKASNRGIALVRNDAIGSATLLAAAFLLGRLHGITGVAWSLMTGGFVAAALMAFSASFGRLEPTHGVGSTLPKGNGIQGWRP